MRTCLYRKKLKEAELPVNQIIYRRAAYCIQAWWSGLKLRKRAIALANIRNHIAKITTPDLYLEQTVYQNINAVISQAH